MKLGDIAYAVNTFPKAFFVWGILEENPLRPSDMEEKLREQFPSLSKFGFLNAQYFRQYCVKSLSDAVDETEMIDNRMGVVHAYSLKDLSLRDYAALILVKSAKLKTSPEHYLTPGRNSKEKANKLTIDILLRLYEHGKENVDSISEALGLDDACSAYRHIDHLAKTGLVTLTTFVSDKDHVGYRWIKGKRAKNVDSRTDKAVKEGYSTVMEELAKILPRIGDATGFSELAQRTGYSNSTVKKALYDLKRQAFVEKISHGKYAIVDIKRKGKKVVKQIVKPMIEASEGQLRLQFEPTNKQLIYGMQMYQNKLNARNTKPRNP